jgi:1-acyl-sn-glycerol-3-phosphate acyltransferase
LLYRFLKIIVSVAIRIFCRKIVINNSARLKESGPLLLACNHPNSFLDAVILDTLFKQPVYSLARGDVFVNKYISTILRALKILPVYRVSEGVENLSSNYETFDECKDLFRKKGTILIFSEGRCINEWHLRPLKKGTARLAIDSWENGIPVRILPVGINYNSFKLFGKNVFINFGSIIEQKDINMRLADGLRHQQFNNLLRNELKGLVYEIPKEDAVAQKKRLSIHIPFLKKFILFIPAIVGTLIHLPHYIPVKLISKRIAAHNDHFDSVIITLLLFSYPLYIAGIIAVLYLILKTAWVLCAILVLPVLAWAAVQLNKQTDGTQTRFATDSPAM